MKSMPKSEILTPRMIKARERAALILQGATYTEAGQATYPNTAHPRQSVYRSLQSETGQEALRHVAEQIGYNPAKLRAKLGKVLDSGKTPAGVLVRAIELGMRSEAMLTDRQESKVMTREDKDLSQYTPAELHKALLDRIRDSQDAA